MSKTVVEHQGVPVGIAVPDGDAVKFIAVKFPVIDLDGTRYENVEAVRAAVSRHIERGPVEAA